MSQLVRLFALITSKIKSVMFLRVPLRDLRSRRRCSLLPGKNVHFPKRGWAVKDTLAQAASKPFIKIYITTDQVHDDASRMFINWVSDRDIYFKCE